MASLPTTPQSPSQILSKGIEIGVNSFPKLFMLTTLAGFLALIPGLYLALHIGNVAVTPKEISAAKDWAWYLIEAPCLLIGVLLQALLIVRLDDFVQTGQTEFRAEFKRALNVLLPLIAGSIVLVCALIVGYVMLIVPGIILTISLAFFQFCVVLDRQGPIAGLNRSHTLVWGNWWRTFWVMLLILLVIVLIAVMLLAPIALLLGLHPDSVTGRDLLVENVLQMVAEALFTPFVLGVMYTQYNDLKLRRAQTLNT